MAGCGVIFAGNSFDCDNKPGQGLRQRVILINKEDIDTATTVVDRTLTTTAGTHKVTSLALNATKLGYAIEGIPAKQILTSAYTYNVNDLINDWTHTVGISLWNQCEDALVFLKGLGEGAQVVAIVEYKVTGMNGLCKYYIYGYDKGLVLTEAAFSSVENGGTVPLVLASADGDAEPFPPMLYLNTDEATTDAEVDALLV